MTKKSILFDDRYCVVCGEQNIPVMSSFNVCEECRKSGKTRKFSAVTPLPMAQLPRFMRREAKRKYKNGGAA